MIGREKKKEGDLPVFWPRDPDELIRILKTPEMLSYLEDRGIYLRFDDKNQRLMITKDKQKFESSYKKEQT